MTGEAPGGFIGVIGNELGYIFVAPDECVCRPRDGGLWCLRADHPTPTSDCTKHLHGIRHVGEKTA